MNKSINLPLLQLLDPLNLRHHSYLSSSAYNDIIGRKAERQSVAIQDTPGASCCKQSLKLSTPIHTQ